MKEISVMPLLINQSSLHKDICLIFLKRNYEKQNRRPLIYRLFNAVIPITIKFPYQS